MKTVCELNKCAGCMACIDKCRKSAIEIKDSLMAYNAVIDEAKCINCNACHIICQENNRPEQSRPIIWKQGWASDERIRGMSSSGGLAASLELVFVELGGLVCSCRFHNGEFRFDFTDNKKDLDSFKGSKYVKSSPVGVYKKIKELIKNRKKVIFVGLPCQVAAIKNFVGDDENLYTIDIICHGTPSPKILEMYLKEKGTSLNMVDEINFRSKTHYGLECNHKTFSIPTITDNYLFTFLNSSTHTDNCYECRYARLERVSDITLGDSWGSQLSEDEKKLGISLMLIQTEKGKKLVEQAELELFDVDLKKAVQANIQLQHPPVKPEQRKKFFKGIEKGFERAVRKCYPKETVKNMIKAVLYTMKN